MNRRWALVASGFGLLAFLAACAGETGQPSAREGQPLQYEPGEIAVRLAANSKQLRAYTWSMRTEVKADGETLSTTFDKIRYDKDGKLEATPTGGSGELTPETQRDVDEAVRLAFSYAQPDPEKFDSFFQRKAAAWEGRGENAGTLRIEGRGYLQPDDEIEIRGKDRLAEHLRAVTTFAGSPLTVDADYEGIPDGPRYVAKLHLTHPRSGFEVNIENFDPAPSGAAKEKTPAPAVKTEEKVVTTIPAGTRLKVRLAQPLDSGRSRSGQSFQAILDDDVVIQGKTLLARGAQVGGTVVEAKGSGRVKGRAKLSMTLASVQAGSARLPIATNTLTFEAEGTKGRDARRIGGGGGLGALIGAVAGGGSGAAKGAAIGAGIGVGATLITKGKEVQFGNEQQLAFTLQKPLQITG